MDRLAVFTLNPWGLRYPGTFWKHPEALALSHGFWWVGNQPIGWFVGLGQKVVLGFEAGKTPKDLESRNPLRGFQDSKPPGPQFTFSWNMEHAKQKVWKIMFRNSTDSDFLVPSFPFQGCTFLLREGKGARRAGEIENSWSSRSSGGSEGQKLRSLHMPVWYFKNSKDSSFQGVMGPM